jgi:glycosyltransferase involved in cell wall biosynthesis
LRYKDLPYISISQAFQRLNYPHDLNYTATIYNGIDLSTFDCDINANRSYLLFLGRVCHDKGTKEAIEIAERLNLPLKIAGKVDDADRNYFENYIKPRLSEKIEYVGEVGVDQKLELYNRAIAIAYPINFEEPFGLVMVEAMAAGTPVMAFERGSVAEIVIDGKNGIVGHSVEELVSRFPEIQQISHSECRQRAVHFSKERMVSSYISLYESLCRQPRYSMK